LASALGGFDGQLHAPATLLLRGTPGWRAAEPDFVGVEIKKRFLGCPVHSLVTTLTQLFLLLILWHNTDYNK